jgi:hypothetical protein
MINYQLLELLETILGKGRQTSGDNVAFFSPFCDHHKQKLEINLDSSIKENPWHCWISNEKGRSVHTLFKKLRVNKNVIKKLEDITGSKFFFAGTEKENKLRLPDEFIPISTLKPTDLKNPYIKNVLVYLKKRGINAIDIVRYNIGYCSSGEYGGRILIPSYDAHGNLNYFITRSLSDFGMKYKNPKVSKDIIPFDFYINWDIPVVLVEGVFDAIAVKYNAIPLLGKFMSKELRKKIIEKNVRKIYLALDTDAITDTIKIATYCMNNGISVYNVNLDKKDPSEMGHREFMEKYKNAELLSSSKLMEMEILL